MILPMEESSLIYFCKLVDNIPTIKDGKMRHHYNKLESA